ncbi:hypothetical protein GEMRC1_003836 [Eukaryota sp. GEM-RC1]
MTDSLSIERFLQDVNEVFTLPPERDTSVKPFLGKDATRLSFGLSNPTLRKQATIIGKSYRKNLTVVDVSDALFDLYSTTQYLEPHIFIPCLLTAISQPSDFTNIDVWNTIKRFVPFADSWVAVDMLCLEYLGRFPVFESPFLDDVREWNSSSKLFVRRTSIAVFCRPCRKIAASVPVALEVTKTLLECKDNLIRKCVAWICKESSKSDPSTVFMFLRQNYTKIYWGTLNDAMSKLNQEQRSELTKLKKGR